MTTYKLDDKITFGKYSARVIPVALTIRQIIDTDPEYLGWCLDNVGGFELDSEAEGELSDATMRWEAEWM